jgi:hypothetical protein
VDQWPGDCLARQRGHPIDDRAAPEPPITSVRQAFRDWKIWRGEFCYTAELRPTPTSRCVVVSVTLAGLSAKLSAEPPPGDGAV